MTPVAAARAGRSAPGGVRLGEDAHKRLTWLAIAIFPIAAIAVVGPMFGAGLGPVDDHEIPHLLAGAPIVDVGRFRPLYWAFRLLEVHVWGTNADGWYLDRLGLLVVTLAFGYALARRWLSVLAAAIAALLLIAGPEAEAFRRLGPQEAFAVPLTIAGVLLLAQRRHIPGLALLTLAALTKEPFVVALAAGVAWTWLRDRRAAGAGAIALAVVSAFIARAVLLNGGDYYSARGLPIPDLSSSPRYLYPWILPFAFGAAWLVDRRRSLALVAAAAIAVGLYGAASSSAHWGRTTRAFNATLAELRADPRPLVVSVIGPSGIEPAVALRRYLPDKAMAIAGIDELAGFAPVSGDCLEVAVWQALTGACREGLILPTP